MTRRVGNLKKAPGARFYAEIYGPDTWEVFLEHLEKLGTPEPVTKLEGMPTRGAFDGKMKRDAAFAARANALWQRGFRSTNRSASDWRAFLAAVSELGSPHLVWRLPGMPAKASYQKKRRRDPLFAQQIDAVWRRLGISAQIWDALLEHLTRLSMIDACAQPGMPHIAALRRHRQIDSSFNARVVAVVRDPANRHLHHLRHDGGEWDEVLGFLARSRSIRAACASPGMPEERVIRRHARSDPGFSAALADIVRKHTAQRISQLAERRLARAAETAVASKRLAPGESFRLALSRDELYATVAAAVPRSLPSITRDDIICDMVLAVLEGEIEIEKVKVAAKDFVREHWRMFGTLRDKSLDVALYDGHAATLGESLAGHGADYW